jgi:flagellar hook-associated protein 3 FlgL
MTMVSIGDLAQSLALRQESLRLQSDLVRLSTELATGRKSDVTSAVAGDFGALGSIEASLSRLGAYTLSGREAAMTTSAVQSVLETVQTNLSGLAGPLLITLDGGAEAAVDAAVADAEERFGSVIAALNTQIADRSIFAGSAVDGSALANAGIMLDALSAATTGETTATGVEAAVRAWFSPGGGFDSIGYLGAGQPSGPARLAEDETVTQPVTAADPALREALAAMAMAALVDRGVLSGAASERAGLAQRAGEALLNAEAQVVGLRAEVGAREAQIDRTLVRNEASRASLELARTELLAADPFETATRLQEVEAQLEALFTVTARLSRLSLTEFLR